MKTKITSIFVLIIAVFFIYGGLANLMGSADLARTINLQNLEGDFESIEIYSYAYSDDNKGRANYSSQEFENIVPDDSCSCIAFRFDDVQNGWLSFVQLEIIQKFRGQNIPLTIGIMGNELRGYMATYVKEITNEANSTIEIANHGWLHEDFTTIDKKTQSQLMQKTNKKIFEVTGKTPSIFIPPFNVFNNDTIKAMKENNFTHFSSSVVNSQPPYPLKKSDLYHFPETATTGTISSELNLFEGLSHKETLKDIQASQNIFGFSVVVMHPQEFSIIKNGAYSDQIDPNQIHELDLLINEIQKSNLKIVFLSQINENLVDPLKNKKTELAKSGLQNQVGIPNLEFGSRQSYQSTPIPSWIKTNAEWWVQDRIDDQTFIQGIQFLIKEGIMVVPKTEKVENYSEALVPFWIKNNAGWWTQGLISDDDFLKGITFLVEKGIIVL